MNLTEEIDALVSKLKSGDGDPKKLILDLVQRARGAGSVTVMQQTSVCPGCGEAGVLCFHCKVKETVGEKAMEAAPGMAMMLGAQIQSWYADRKVRKAAEVEAARRRAQQPPPPPPPPPIRPWTPPPPPPGAQRF